MTGHAKYVIDLFRRIYLIPDHIAIAYGAGESADVIIPDLSDHFFSRRDALPQSTDRRNHEGLALPVFFCGAEQQWYTIEGRQAIFNHDLIASAFYLLCGWHECFGGTTDKYGRYPYRGSLTELFDIDHIPVVNIYFSIMAEAIGKLTGEAIPVKRWGDKPFSICLTHDVDKCHSGWMEDGFAAIRKGKPGGAARLAAKRLGGRDPWFNFDEIIKLEQKHAVCSCFFFIPEKGNGNADYELSDDRFDEVYRQIIAAGSETGLHTPLGSASDEGHLRRNLSSLRHTPKGMRCHFLQYDPLKTPGVMAAAGIAYDSSVAFAEKAGFRRGICHPYPLFDLRANKTTDVIEVPLHLMDTTFEQNKYSGGGIPSAVKTAGEMMETTARFGGCLTLLWHNNFFSEFKYAGWGAAYEQIIAMGKAMNAAFVLPGKAAEFI